MKFRVKFGSACLITSCRAAVCQLHPLMSRFMPAAGVLSVVLLLLVVVTSRRHGPELVTSNLGQSSNAGRQLFNSQSNLPHLLAASLSSDRPYCTFNPRIGWIPEAVNESS